MVAFNSSEEADISSADAEVSTATADMVWTLPIMSFLLCRMVLVASYEKLLPDSPAFAAWISDY